MQIGTLHTYIPEYKRHTHKYLYMQGSLVPTVNDTRFRINTMPFYIDLHRHKKFPCHTLVSASSAFEPISCLVSDSHNTYIE